jgi:hypothetical protein
VGLRAGPVEKGTVSLGKRGVEKGEGGEERGGTPFQPDEAGERVCQQTEGRNLSGLHGGCSMVPLSMIMGWCSDNTSLVFRSPIPGAGL